MKKKQSLSVKLQNLKASVIKPKRTSKKSTETSKTERADKVAGTDINDDEVVLEDVDIEEKGTSPDEVQKGQVTDGNGNPPVENAQSPQTMDEIPLNDEEDDEQTTSVDLNDSDSSSSV